MPRPVLYHVLLLNALLSNAETVIRRQGHSKGVETQSRRRLGKRLRDRGASGSLAARMRVTTKAFVHDGCVL